jgi:hypothetical protein
MNLRTESAEQMNPRRIKVLLFGASGMLGTAVMRECLADPQVARIMTVGRTTSALHSAKFEQIVHADLSKNSQLPRLTRSRHLFLKRAISASSQSDKLRPWPNATAMLRSCRHEYFTGRRQR